MRWAAIGAVSAALFVGGLAAGACGSSQHRPVGTLEQSVENTPTAFTTVKVPVTKAQAMQICKKHPDVKEVKDCVALLLKP